MSDQYGDRYDGNGAPIWHDHFFPTTPMDEPDFDDYDNDDWRYDALEFENGKIAVWSAKTGRVVSYEKTRIEAIKSAMVRANADYANRVKNST